MAIYCELHTIKVDKADILPGIRFDDALDAFNLRTTYSVSSQ
jgi:hypothetical protein